MREVLKFKGSFGQVVWLEDDNELHIIEADWREYHKRLIETDDRMLAAAVFFRTAENLL
jgi:hypothetical protein